MNYKRDPFDNVQYGGYISEDERTVLGPPPEKTVHIESIPQQERATVEAKGWTFSDSPTDFKGVSVVNQDGDYVGLRYEQIGKAGKKVWRATVPIETYIGHSIKIKDFDTLDDALREHKDISKDISEEEPKEQNVDMAA